MISRRAFLLGLGLGGLLGKASLGYLLSPPSRPLLPSITTSDLVEVLRNVYSTPVINLINQQESLWTILSAQSIRGPR